MGRVSTATFSIQIWQISQILIGKTKCIGTSVMTPSNTELHWRVYKNEPKISSTISQKWMILQILEFMATFSAWIPDHQVLRCGLLQNKSYKCGKKLLNFCTSGAGAKDSDGVQSIGRRMRLQTNRNVLWDRKGSNSAAHGGENNSERYCFAPFSIPSCFAMKRPLLIFCYLARRSRTEK